MLSKRSSAAADERESKHPYRLEDFGVIAFLAADRAAAKRRHLG